MESFLIRATTVGIFPGPIYYPHCLIRRFQEHTQCMDKRNQIDADLHISLKVAITLVLVWDIDYYPEVSKDEEGFWNTAGEESRTHKGGRVSENGIFFPDFSCSWHWMLNVVHQRYAALEKEHVSSSKKENDLKSQLRKENDARDPLGNPSYTNNIWWTRHTQFWLNVPTSTSER